jgi:hypothetical protein
MARHRDGNSRLGLDNSYSHYHMEAIFWTELANPPLEPMSSTAFLSNFVNNG